MTFSGRAIRSEYWFWVLFTVLVGLATEILVAVRRLHDIDRGGWWILITLTIIGIFVLIYWAAKEGTPGPNRFGPDPFDTGGARISIQQS